MTPLFFALVDAWIGRHSDDMGRAEHSICPVSMCHVARDARRLGAWRSLWGVL